MAIVYPEKDIYEEKYKLVSHDYLFFISCFGVCHCSNICYISVLSHPRPRTPRPLSSRPHCSSCSTSSNPPHLAINRAANFLTPARRVAFSFLSTCQGLCARLIFFLSPIFPCSYFFPVYPRRSQNCSGRASSRSSLLGRWTLPTGGLTTGLWFIARTVSLKLFYPLIRRPALPLLFYC